MKLKIGKQEKNKLEFELQDTSTFFANAIRRYIMNKVPALAIDEITFYENGSVVFDEYIAHRIGLIPIITPKDLSKESEINFYLDAKGPGTVYSSELKTKDKEVKVAKDKIPIITLGENQQLRLEGKARLGTSTQHAKFQPGLSAYEIVDGNHKFIVESFFQMPVKELVERAASVLEADIEKIEEQLKKANKK